MTFNDVVDDNHNQPDRNKLITIMNSHKNMKISIGAMWCDDKVHWMLRYANETKSSHKLKQGNRIKAPVMSKIDSHPKIIVGEK